MSERARERESVCVCVYVCIIRSAPARTLQGKALGGTWDFTAPELRASNMATSRTDMYAYGKSVACIRAFACPALQAHILNSHCSKALHGNCTKALTFQKLRIRLWQIRRVYPSR